MWHYLFALLVPLIIAGGGYQAHFLTVDGALAAIVVGFFTAEAGWDLAAQVILFFLLGSFATKFKHATKESMMPFRAPPETQDKEKEKDKNKPPRKGRGMWQVLATGGVPALFCAVRYILPSVYATWYPWLFFGYISCCCGDTLASELGMLARQRPRLITNMSRVVKPGVDGGITAHGTMCSIIGGAIIGATTFSLGGIYLGALWGGLGSSMDSIFGALLQPSSQSAAFVSSSSKEKYTVKDEQYFAHWQKMNTVVNFVSSFLASILCLIVGDSIWLNIVCCLALLSVVGGITYYHFKEKK